MTIRSKYQYKCDYCDSFEYTDRQVLPKSWTFVNLASKFSTGHGYTINRTATFHFCTEECKNDFLDHGNRNGLEIIHGE
jgi:hypothetical protein